MLSTYIERWVFIGHDAQIQYGKGTNMPGIWQGHKCYTLKGAGLETTKYIARFEELIIIVHEHNWS